MLNMMIIFSNCWRNTVLYKVRCDITHFVDQCRAMFICRVFLCRKRVKSHSLLMTGLTALNKNDQAIFPYEKKKQYTYKLQLHFLNSDIYFVISTHSLSRNIFCTQLMCLLYIMNLIIYKVNRTQSLKTQDMLFTSYMILTCFYLYCLTFGSWASVGQPLHQISPHHHH